MGEPVQTPRRYVVALRGPASARLEPEQSLQIPGFPTRYGPIDVTFRTRYEDRGYEVQVPLGLWVDVRGLASCSLQEAMEAFASGVLALKAVVSFAANAAMELEIELAYDATPGTLERDYFQAFVPEQHVYLPASRRVPAEAAIAVLRGLSAHARSTRIHRAMAHYSEALRHWRLMEETSAFVHLQVAAEALTKPAKEAFLAREGIREGDLPALWGVGARLVDSEARKRLVYRGDVECYGAAKAARDGYLHSFGSAGKVQQRVLRIHAPVAAYVRSLALELIGLEQSHMTLLLSAPYDRPRGPLRAAKYLRGKLIGESDDLAADDQEYPLMVWESGIESVSLDDAGQYVVRPKDQVTARLGHGVRFRPESIEYWDDGRTRTRSSRDL